MNKNKVLVWIIVLLAVLNITTIATIVYHVRQDKKNAETSIVIGSGNPLNGSYLRSEVGFDDEQMDAFRSANKEFRPVSNEIIYKMDSLKHLMFDEINKEPIDSLKINQLSKDFGELHAQLKEITNKFYLQLKSISTPEQSEKLKETFAPLFYQDGANRFERGRGQGKEQGRGPGQGQGQGRLHQNQIEKN